MAKDILSGARVGGVWPVTNATKTGALVELLDLAPGPREYWPMRARTGQLGNYRVHLDDLDRVGAQAVENALNSDTDHRG